MAWTAKVCALTAALAATGAAQAGELALKRVVLSTGGVGLYEYEAEVEGDATVELTVRLDQVDDVLKSLVVFDDHGGVGGLDLASAQPLAETFRSLPFNEADLQSTPQLLSALRGAEVEVGGAHAMHGRIVAVTRESETQPNGGGQTFRNRVSVMSDKGLEQFILEEAESVRFADPAINQAVSKALLAVASNHERDSRVLRLLSKGADKRKLRVAYLAAAPVWKASYRLVLDPAPDAKTGLLQGWATLENLSGQDWKGVDLTLVSGRPVSFRQALYRSYMVERPEAPLDIGATLTAALGRRDSLAMQAPAAAPVPVGGVMSMAKSANVPRAQPATDAIERERQTAEKPLAAGAEVVAAQEGVTQVSFHIPFAVSVEAGRTLSLPIIDAQEPVQRVALYDPQIDRRHPLNGAELVNDGQASLPPGIVTIYESGAGGASYVGDARLPALPAGDKRILSFALDQKTTIDEDQSDMTSLARAKQAKGVLTVEKLYRTHVVYHVKASEPRHLVVYVPKLGGGKLTEPDSKNVVEAEGRYSVPFEVKAGDKQDFGVTQERTDTQFVGLAELDDANLAVYVKSGEIDAATRATLSKLAALRAAQAQAESAFTDTQTKIEAVEADQTRLKDLVGAVAAGSDLAKRYLKKLDADETELEGLKAAQATREKASADAKAAVEGFVAGL